MKDKNNARNSARDVARNDADFGETEAAYDDPAFDAWVAAQAKRLNAPGSVPKGEMWEAIQAARRTAEDAQAGRIPGVTPLRRHWKLMSVIAAALLIGVGMDRMVLSRPTSDVPRPTTVARAPVRQNDPARLYRMAAAQTLGQAEALLIAYRASSASRNPADAKQLSTWGRHVLGSTRLLLDSPAGADPQLKALLNDLELVLVQIIQASGAPLDPSERELINRALEDRDLLPRIRTAVPADIAASTASE